MPRFEDFINQSQAYRANLAQQDAKAKAGMASPLAIIANAVVGYMTGGPAGAVAGAIGGTQVSQDASAGDVAKSLAGSYTTGRGLAQQAKFDKAFPEIKDIPDEYRKELAEILFKNKYPQQYQFDPGQLTQMMSSLGSKGIQPKTMNPPEGTTDIDDETGKPIIFKNGEWRFK